MWYILALFIYRLTIEALGKIRFIVPLSILFALWAGTRPEFTTFLSSSRIVVFFPFFVAGYLWKSEYITAIRKFKGKWILVAISGVLLWAIPNYMIPNEMGIAIFRGNHGYQLCGLTDPQGVILRLLMYLVSFVVVYTMLALVPDIKLPLTYVGRHTMGIYFFHYPIMIIMNGLYILMLPAMNNVWVLLGVSLVFVLVLGSLPVDLLYTGVLNLIAFILIKKDKTVRDEGLEEEYDSEYDEYELLRRKKAIAELAATLDSESEQDGHVEKVNMDEDTPDHISSDSHEGFSNVAGMELEIEEDNLDDIPDELIKGEEELSLEDLIQEGNVGLIMALDTLELREDGISEAEYIREGIRGAMENLLEEEAGLQKSDGQILERINYIGEAIRNLSEELERKVTLEELSAYLDMPEAEIADVLRLTGEDIKTEQEAMEEQEAQAKENGGQGTVGYASVEDFKIF